MTEFSAWGKLLCTAGAFMEREPSQYTTVYSKSDGQSRCDGLWSGSCPDVLSSRKGQRTQRLAVTSLSLGCAFVNYWVLIVPKLMLDGEGLTTADCCTYLEHLLTDDGNTALRMSTLMFRARVTSTRLKHLCRWPDVSLGFLGFVYCTIARSILLNEWNTWNFRADDVRHSEVFDHCYLRDITWIEWNHRMSNAKAGNRV